MALSNAERQRRYRHRRKQQIMELQAELGEVAVVDRPEDANGSDAEFLPRRLQSLYGAIDHIHDTCRMATNIDPADLNEEADARHLNYMVFRLSDAERLLRELRKKLAEKL